MSLQSTVETAALKTRLRDAWYARMPYWRAKEVEGLDDPKKGLIWLHRDMTEAEYQARLAAIPFTRRIWAMFKERKADA
jgi:hypothetical protein